ncbi:MAG: primosomal protein N', partial [Oscillibacter sp.]|nr:primosomal protein N' [Oscillibacter sp.]
METAVIVKVAVSAAPYSIDKAYDYLVPESLLDGAKPGVRAAVPFGRGNRQSEAMILSRTAGEKTPGLKPISRLLDESPVMGEGEIALALWMRARYFCTLYDAIRTILPAGLWYDCEETWKLLTDADTARAQAGRIQNAEAAIAALADAGGSAKLPLLREKLGESAEKTLKA